MMPPRMSQDEIIEALKKLALEHHSVKKQRSTYQDYYTYRSSRTKKKVYSKIEIIIRKAQRTIKFLFLNFLSINRKSG